MGEKRRSRSASTDSSSSASSEDSSGSSDSSSSSNSSASHRSGDQAAANAAKASPPPAKQRKRSPSPVRERKKTPPPPESARVYIGRLTRSVTKEHVSEIFGNFGTVKMVDMPQDSSHPEFSRGFCYVEFEKPPEAHSSVKYMDGGQIDGAEVTVQMCLEPRGDRRRRSPRRHSPARRSGRRSGRSLS